MIYRRRTDRVEPERAEAFNALFNEHLLPLQRKYGRRLIGRWITEDRTEIVAIWAYRDRAEYEEMAASAVLNFLDENLGPPARRGTAWLEWLARELRRGVSSDLLRGRISRLSTRR